jgi:hypothetical protein
MAEAPLFQTWEGFFEAFTASLNSELYGDRFPAYKARIDREGGKVVERRIIAQLLDAGLNPQEGLDGFVQAVLNGNRYANSLRKYVSELIGPFLDAGAVPRIADLFKPTYPVVAPERLLTEADLEGDTDWEREGSSNYDARGVLLDGFSEAMAARGEELDPALLSGFDFGSIQPAYWDEVAPGVSFEKARMMVLKRTSSLLGGRQPLQGGKRRKGTRRRGRSARRSLRKGSRSRRSRRRN